MNTFIFSIRFYQIKLEGIRQMFGCNDNPSARQWEAAWRKLLGQHQITVSDSANCINNDVPFLSVLNVSSRKEKAKVDSLVMIDAHNENNNNDHEAELDQLDIDVDPLFVTFLTDDMHSGDIEDHIASYSAAVLERCIIERRWYE